MFSDFRDVRDKLTNKSSILKWKCRYPFNNPFQKFIQTSIKYSSSSKYYSACWLPVKGRLTRYDFSRSIYGLTMQTIEDNEPQIIPLTVSLFNMHL